MRPKPRKKLLLVDDEPDQHQLLGDFLVRQGFAVQSLSNASSALEIVRKTPPDMVVMDIRMPGMDGLEALRAIRKVQPDLPVLLITAYADIRDAVRAMKDGAVDYLAKPIDLNELEAAIGDVMGHAEPLQEEVSIPPLPPGVILASPALQQVVKQIALVAASDATVVFTGESGTGKEVLTEILHQWSPRGKNPLVKVNCAAIPDTLLESELFGYEPGAFTGAVKAKPGRFEAANRGTLFLDEIVEMPLSLQVKLLRALEDHTIVRLGSDNPIQVDFRLTAATNQDMEQAVRDGRFREDLFYRLSVIEIHVPPMRERREDISKLAAEFARQFTQDKVRISPLALHSLEEYSWPGNVRELRNEIERACLLCRGNVILPEHLSHRIAQVTGHARRPDLFQGKGATLADVEKATILHTLEACGGNRTQAAKKLGISRRALIYKIRSYEAQDPHRPVPDKGD